MEEFFDTYDYVSAVPTIQGYNHEVFNKLHIGDLFAQHVKNKKEMFFPKIHSQILIWKFFLSLMKQYIFVNIYFHSVTGDNGEK